jgi:ribonuclease HI
MLCISTDGSLVDGQGGWGACIRHPDGSTEVMSGNEANAASNNRMELMAVLQAMYQAQGKPVTIITDSATVLSQLEPLLSQREKKHGLGKAYRRSSDQDLWDQVIRLLWAQPPGTFNVLDLNELRHDGHLHHAHKDHQAAHRAAGHAARMGESFSVSQAEGSQGFESSRFHTFRSEDVGDAKRVLFPDLELFAASASRPVRGHPLDYEFVAGAVANAARRARQTAKGKRYALLFSIPSPTGAREESGQMQQHAVIAAVDREARTLLLHDPLINDLATGSKIAFHDGMRRMLAETYPEYSIIESSAGQERRGESCCMGIAAYNLWKLGQHEGPLAADSLPDRAMMVDEWPQLMRAVAQGAALRQREDEGVQRGR